MARKTKRSVTLTRLKILDLFFVIRSSLDHIWSLKSCIFFYPNSDADTFLIGNDTYNFRVAFNFGLLVIESAVSIRSNPTMAVLLMCIVTKQQPVGVGQCSKRDWTAPLISTEAGTTTNEASEVWLVNFGLDLIRFIAWQKNKSRLRVDLEDFNKQTAYAEYDLFGVADEGNKYKLSLGTYSGTNW